MSFNSFLKLVEIQTKVASVIPFTAGSLFAYYRYGKINWLHLVIMLIALLCIDMATTAINNYMDFKKARLKEGYNYEDHNAMVKHGLKDRSALAVIMTLLVIGTIAGIYLVFLTDVIVLLLGGLSFTIGILYSYGPLPISRTPFGELFSGFFMGFVIIFISVYIHLPTGDLVSLSISGHFIGLQVNFYELIILFLFSLPMIAGISNIMLANNICDMEDDAANHRQTLPLTIGKRWALVIYNGLYISSGLAFVVLVLMGILHPLSLLGLVTGVPVAKLIKTFNMKQEKQTTFITAVKGFVLIGVTLILVVALNSIF